MTLTPKRGYGPYCYTVKYTWEWDKICRWMDQNNISWWHVSSGPEGNSFQVKDNVEWFILRWC